MPTSIVGVPNAPVSLTTCKLQKGGMYRGRWSGNFVIANRTKHFLASARIMLVAYDGENTRMDQRGLEVSYADPVASGESTSSPLEMEFSVQGREALIARVSCRVQGATFSGNKRWSFGEKWPEKLLPLQSEAAGKSDVVGGGGAAAPKPTVSAPRASIVVTNSWNDVVNGVTFVHVALSFSAGDAPAVVRPSDVQLTMSLANGLQKTYTALATSAPTYQKLNPLGSSTTTAYEVTPSEDFGRIGPVTVPAHGAGRVIATFAVAEALANPTNNRAVSLK